MVFAWVLFVIFVVITILLLSGKGSILVAGYNTMSRQEKEKHDSKKVSKDAGFAMLLIDIAFFVLLIIIQLFLAEKVSQTKMSYGIGFFILSVLVIVVFSCVNGFKNAKK